MMPLLKVKIGDIVVVREDDGKIAYADMIIEDKNEMGYYRTMSLFDGAKSRASWEKGEGVEVY